MACLPIPKATELSAWRGRQEFSSPTFPKVGPMGGERVVATGCLRDGISSGKWNTCFLAGFLRAFAR